MTAPLVRPISESLIADQPRDACNCVFVCNVRAVIDDTIVDSATLAFHCLQLYSCAVIIIRNRRAHLAQ